VKRLLVVVVALIALLSAGVAAADLPFHGYLQSESNLQLEDLKLEAGLYTDLSPSLTIGGAVMVDAGSISGFTFGDPDFQVYAELHNDGGFAIRLTGTKKADSDDLIAGLRVRIGW
jgi:hypothetical protein